MTIVIDDSGVDMQFFVLDILVVEVIEISLKGHLPRELPDGIVAPFQLVKREGVVTIGGRFYESHIDLNLSLLLDPLQSLLILLRATVLADKLKQIAVL